VRAAAIYAGLALLAGACQKQPSPATPPTPTPTGKPSSPAWTPERVREFVIDTEQLVQELRAKQREKHGGGQAQGECYGDDAFPAGKVSEIVPVLEARLTGQALRCYLATNFGCRMGDIIARAGVSRDVIAALPFHEAKAAILEQTPDRVVAEVGEAEFNMVNLDGKIDPKQANGTIEHKRRSRYTLTRDDKGVWRISDRIPGFKDWECREK